VIDAPDARALYEALSDTHRRESARWVADGKKEQTRAMRASKAIDMLRSGVRTPG
jgi:uncharacterized protein YdeI (YjbR/CyaY-like superfamily)